MMKKCLICNKFYDMNNSIDEKLYNFFNETEDKNLVLENSPHELDYCDNCFNKIKIGEIKLTKEQIERDIDLWVRVYIRNNEGKPYRVIFTGERGKDIWCAVCENLRKKKKNCQYNKNNCAFEKDKELLKDYLKYYEPNNIVEAYSIIYSEEEK